MGKLLTKQVGSETLWYYKDEEPEIFEIPLTEDNTIAHTHRKLPLLDRVAIEDPRDEEWWVWYRYSEKPDQFGVLLQAAHEIGTIIFRDTPMEHVQQGFDVRYVFTDEDYDALREE